MTSTIKVDTISENTSANGVTIDGLTIKDGGITATTGATVFNEASADVDFRVESNGNTHALFVDAGNEQIGLLPAGATVGADVQIGFHDTATTATSMGTAHANDATLLIGGANSGTTQGSIYLGGQNISADGVAGAIYGFSGGNQSSGIEFLEGSSDAHGQIKMSIAQGTGGTLVEALKIANNGATTITVTDNSDTLTLISTDADANKGPVLNLYRNSGSAAPNDVIGKINITGRNDNSEDVIYQQYENLIADETDGTEDGYQIFYQMKAGTLTERYRIETGTMVINDPGNDFDFRIESNSNANMLLVDASADVVTFGTTATSPGYSNNTAGVSIKSTGALYASATNTFHSFNRSNDGTVIAFSSAGGQEGLISISGGTTSYAAFTGSHWSRLADNSKPTILRGTIIESIDTMMDWYYAEADGDIKAAITLPNGKSVGDSVTFTADGVEHTGVYKKEDDIKHVKSKISDTADSTKVYGVFSSWDDSDDGLDNDVNDFYVAQVGTYIIRVHQDVTVAAGDLLVSNGDGTAKVQDDDIIRSKTLGKVLTNIKQETYDDGSYTVPCALYCG